MEGIFLFWILLLNFPRIHCSKLLLLLLNMTQTFDTILCTYFAYLCYMTTLCYDLDFAPDGLCFTFFWRRKYRGKRENKALSYPLASVLVPFLLQTWHSIIILWNVRVVGYCAVDALTHSRVYFVAKSPSFSTLCGCAAGGFAWLIFKSPFGLQLWKIRA